MARGQANAADAWCILQVAASRTLATAQALSDSGFEVWTPTRTIKRPAPGQRRKLVMGQRRVMVEVDRAIVPGIVFARASRLDDLLRLSARPGGARSTFTIMRLGDLVPLVANAEVNGLREEEARAATAIQAEREAETREEERRVRAERLGSERAKRKALRQQIKLFDVGTPVQVDGASSLAGMVGHIVWSRGANAVIDFGGLLRELKVEAWQVRRAEVQEQNIAA